MARIIEKIVNTRLVWLLEIKILSNLQSGFRKHRSTTDNITIIKLKVNNVLNSNSYLSLISIDISKDYDSVWRHRVRERIVINRLQIGHTRLTDKFLMIKEEPPQCPFCEVILTIKHLKTKCFKYIEDAKKNNILSNIDEALVSITEYINNMVKFLRKTHLLNQI
ncbi:putative RNA-directed DNA polymerase [Aphis craccivora]|uniref:Putative RNA-directed DNA polymerase n=1 Tax=Aphis craccivora TaxID=307492 RepID=A0A6G0Y1Q5_APHCR|nr:putative RNA-directed DNA polymerase [Aphis craccivora]